MNRLFRIQLALTVGVLGVVPLGPLGWLAAQESGLERRLERALLIEKSEHDLAAAEAIYREVIEHRDATGAIKTRARLLLGLCLLDQGKDDEGKEVLEAAAEGEGVDADKARSVLDGRAAAKQRLETTVTELIRNIQGGGMRESLVEIGEPAVPYLIEELRSANDHFRSQSLADTLIRIGSEGVVAFVESVVRSGDVYLERLFLQRISYLASGPQVDASDFADVVRVFLPLVKTAELKTRREIVRLASSVLTTEELLDLLPHPDEYVRNRALSEIESRNILKDAKIMVRVAPIVEGFIGTDDESERNILGDFLEDNDILATRQGKDLVLAALHNRIVVSRNQLIFSIQKGNFLTARGLAELCQTLGPTSGALGQVITALIESSAAYWKGEAVGDVLAMMRSGYGAASIEMLNWLLDTATEAHYALLVEDLDRYGENLQFVLYWMANHTAAGEALPALERAITNPELRRRLAGTQPTQSPYGGAFLDVGEEDPRGLEVVLNAIASIGTGEAADALVRLIRIAPQELEELVVEHLVEGPPSFDRALLPLLDVAPGEDTRHTVLMRLAERGIYDRGAIQRALEKGIDDDDYFKRIVFGSPDDAEGEICLYDRKTVVEILEGMVAGDNPVYWFPLLDAAHSAREQGEDQMLRPLVERLFERALVHPDPRVRSGLVHALFHLGDGYASAKRSLYRRAIGGDDQELFWVAIESDLATPEDLSLLRPFLEGESDLAKRAIRRLVSVRDSHIPWIGAALKNPSPDVRELALEQLYRFGGDVSLDLILPLRWDASTSVRRKLYELLGRSAAPEAADALIEGLRDEDERTRKVAQASLEKIEQYYEHRRRWERLKDAFSVEGGSAEEALVKLAKQGASKKVRVAAIRSLGTLAVPDTLPFLIVLMEDPDADVATAAEEAVDRINTSPNPKPRAPNPSQ